MLKHRQIQQPRACALATAQLLRHVVEEFSLPDVVKLVERIQAVGRRLTTAQPHELAVGNTVRRVLGMIRGEAEEDREGENSSGFGDVLADGRPFTPTTPTKRPPSRRHESQQKQSPTGDKPVLNNESFRHPAAPNSIFSILSQPSEESTASSANPTPGSQSPSARTLGATTKDVRADVVDGIDEIIDELNIVDDQIAACAPNFIHANETILALGTSCTIQTFLLHAASKIPLSATPGTKLTVLLATNPPELAPLATTTEPSSKDSLDIARFIEPLNSAKIDVVHILPHDVAAHIHFARRVLLAPRAVLADGSLICAVGANFAVKAARARGIPVLALAGVFKLTPGFPFEVEELLEYGGVAEEGFGPDTEWSANNENTVENPVDEHVPAGSVDVYITNL